MNIYIIEASNPIDKTHDTTEIKGLKSLGSMFMHYVTSFDVYSKSDFQKIIEYISSIDADEKTGKIEENIVVHISCHGNTEGLAIGKDFISWDYLASILVDLAECKFSEKVLLAISSCGTSEQQFTAAFNGLDRKIRKSISPPSFVVFFEQETVDWDDALISWGLFYHQLGKPDYTDLTKKKLIATIDLVRRTEISKLAYRRWDKTKHKYVRYPLEVKEE